VLYDRLQQEERLEKMEDAGVYENRLGLKEKQRAAILSPAHALPHGASPHGYAPQYRVDVVSCLSCARVLPRPACR
ncbi:MAG: hypothetical protein P4L40_22570, partial [Terracidiphilus sp.]|nr:hypothetical protein [Terracidiphilus sp.]